MKTKNSSLFRRATTAAFVATVLAAASSANAQSWDGGAALPGNNTWGVGANWVGDVAPTFGTSANLTFNNVTRAINDLGNPRTVRSLTYGADIDSDVGTNFRTFDGGASASLTLQAASGNASITVNADATGNINLGYISGTGGTVANLILGSNLDIVHNGSGNLTFSRPITGSFGFTKSGSGTMISSHSPANGNNTFTGAANFNGGRAIFANTINATGDLNSASAVNLGGGTLEIRTTTALNKTLTPNMTVSSASTLVYNNTTNATQTFTVQTGSMVLNAELTLQNSSSNTTLNNLYNVTRDLTGNGNVRVETLNNVSTIDDSFTPGRVQLSGNNTAWTGSLVVANGTLQLSGNNSAQGTGSSITLGTTGSAFGAGLALNRTVNSNITQNVTVASGGFRGFKNTGNASVDNTISGNIILDGGLTVSHSNMEAGRLLTLSGNISGSGALTVDGSVSSGSRVRIAGTNTYGGGTIVNSDGRLDLDGSVTSNVSVDATSTIGGGGSITGDLSLASGAKFIFSLTETLNVSGAVTTTTGFNVASLVNSDGTAVDWAGVAFNTYTLIGGTSTTFSSSNIGNFGFGNAADVGGGKLAYFQQGSLQLVVIPEASTWAIVGLGLFGMVVFHRSRRRSRIA